MLGDSLDKTQVSLHCSNWRYEVLKLHVKVNNSCGNLVVLYMLFTPVLYVEKYVPRVYYCAINKKVTYSLLYAF